MTVFHNYCKCRIQEWNPFLWCPFYDPTNLYAWTANHHYSLLITDNLPNLMTSHHVVYTHDLHKRFILEGSNLFIYTFLPFYLMMILDVGSNLIFPFFSIYHPASLYLCAAHLRTASTSNNHYYHCSSRGTVLNIFVFIIYFTIRISKRSTRQHQLLSPPRQCRSE